MNLRNTDFQLSGISDMTFEACFSSLKAMDEQYHLWRLVTWNTRGQPNTIICDEGTSISDADQILEYDLTQIREYSAEFDIIPSAPPCRVSATRGEHATSNISGFLPLLEIINQSATAASISAILAEYADFILAVASALNTRVLSVADEWCEEGIGPYEIAPPSLLCVIHTRLARGKIPDLRNAGAAIDREINGMMRIWLQPLSSYILGHEPNPLVLDIIRNILSPS